MKFADCYGVIHDRPDVANMTWPVRCLKCGEVFDLTTVEAKARYMDCTVFDHPCCGHRNGDDRPRWWGGTVECIDRAAS